MILLVDSEGPDQTARMRSLIWAFTVRLCPKTQFSMAWPIYGADQLIFRPDKMCLRFWYIEVFDSGSSTRVAISKYFKVLLVLKGNSQVHSFWNAWLWYPHSVNQFVCIFDTQTENDTDKYEILDIRTVKIKQLLSQAAWIVRCLDVCPEMLLQWNLTTATIEKSQNWLFLGMWLLQRD